MPIHILTTLPKQIEATFKAIIDIDNRMATEANHTATHLLHEVLRDLLGQHVEQKGSYVSPESLRFDFSHFSKVSNEELERVENLVNDLVRENILLKELRNISIEAAKTMGAIALFGEKYGDKVRVIRFGSSVELCGGTHIPSTGMIGYFKITSESAIAAGIRRIEAISGVYAEEMIEKMDEQIRGLKDIFKGKDPVLAVNDLNDKLNTLQKEIEVLKKEKLLSLCPTLLSEAKTIGGIKFIAKILDVPAGDLKDIAFGLRPLSDNLVAVLCSNNGEKAAITLFISDKLVKDKGWNAGQIIREIAKPINGGGGGQALLASAGGTNKDLLNEAINVAEGCFSK